MSDKHTPVLIGVGQFTDRSRSADGPTPIDMMVKACELAIEDCGVARIAKQVDALAVVGLTVDAAQVKTPVSRLIKNVPAKVAGKLGIDPAKQFYCEPGGNTPQMLVNHFAQAISKGECGTVLLAGGEALDTMSLRFSKFWNLLLPKGKWKDQTGVNPKRLGDAKEGNSEYEGRYDLNLPANVYPLFENALRAHYGRSLADHQKTIGAMFARMTQVAATNPNAWFQQARSAEDLLNVSADNRMISFPYPKRLNSMIMVNQSAATLMTNVATAKAMGVPRDRWVFLHGYASGNDIWNLSQRPNFYESTAIRDLSQRALSMAGKQVDDIAVFDLYSCFPSAVQMACDALGLAHDDSRGLSLTGGLPYFGGPGNNYSMHAIAEMVSWARAHPNDFGFLNANGWYLTKHAIGVYSASELSKPFEAEPQPYQVDQSKRIATKPNLQGPATVETYTVIYNKHGQAKKAILVVRNDAGDRALAINADAAAMHALVTSEGVGLRGQLIARGNYTHFEPS